MKDKKDKWIKKKKKKKKKFWTHKRERLIKAITKIGKRPMSDVPTFSRKLNLEELIDWINELEEYFKYDEIEDPNRVKFVKAKLKGHAKI